MQYVLVEIQKVQNFLIKFLENGLLRIIDWRNTGDMKHLLAEFLVQKF